MKLAWSQRRFIVIFRIWRHWAELVDQVSLHLKSLIHQLGQSYLKHSGSAKTRTSIELFVQAVNHSPQQWQFMIAERWGGSETVRIAIAREIEF